MSDSSRPQQAPQRVIKTRREYNIWVADESIEDYALRYAPTSVRNGHLGPLPTPQFRPLAFGYGSHWGNHALAVWL